MLHLIANGEACCSLQQHITCVQPFIGEFFVCRKFVIIALLLIALAYTYCPKGDTE